ncbi:hypothetical protein HK101_006976 [Irineochytrium annulatum]|nr:hypothetical protein HK101_006976 [Irineochytrium annulatum]
MTAGSTLFVQIGKTWDRGNRAIRERILQEFVDNNKGKTGPQLEREFGNGASLFLTRITTWLRLTYLLGYNISLQLQAISIFISAASGHRFLAEFLEVGGVLTVLELLGLSQIKEVDKAEALRLLLHVANAGRKYKEFLCESYGVRSVADCLARSRSEITQDYCRNLLYQLGVPSIQTIHTSVVDATLSLLKNPHIQIQYEGYEILRDLVYRPTLQDNVLIQLIATLKNSYDDAGDEVADDRRRRGQKGNEGKTLNANQWSTAMKADEKVTDGMLATYIQQAYAAKLLGVMAASSDTLAERMIQLQITSGLLNTIANTAHPDSQRYAANTLLYLVHNFDYVADALQDHMGRNFFDLLEGKPDTFYRELTWEQVRYLRKNTVKIHAAVEKDSILTDDDSGESGSSDEEGDDIIPALHEEKELIEEKPKDKTQQQIMTEYEQMKDPNEQAMVKDLYQPFSHTITNTTFSNNKFQKEGHANIAERFDQDMEQFRAQNSKRVMRDRVEFEVKFDPKLRERIQVTAKAGSFLDK